MEKKLEKKKIVSKYPEGFDFLVGYLSLMAFSFCSLSLEGHFQMATESQFINTVEKTAGDGSTQEAAGYHTQGQ